jgi:hypothetical protein
MNGSGGGGNKPPCMPPSHSPQYFPPPPPQQQQQQPQHTWNGYRELEALLLNVSPTLRSAIWNSVDRIVRDQAQEYRQAAANGLLKQRTGESEHSPIPDNKSRNNSASANSAAVTKNHVFTEKVVAAMINSRKRGVGGDDLELRRDIKKVKTVREKVQLLCQIHDKIKTQGLEDSKLTEGARTFVCRSLRPIMGCLTKHCDSDVDRFCSKWPKLAISSFCCNGNRPECVFIAAADEAEGPPTLEQQQQPECHQDQKGIPTV